MRKFLGCLAVIGLFLAAMFSMSYKAMAADEETNKKILKDAIVGAITGAVATEATKDMPKESVESVKHEGPDPFKDGEKHRAKKHKHHKHDKSKDGHRPPGWDKGKKEGWNGGDVPPGLAGHKDKE